MSREMLKSLSQAIPRVFRISTTPGIAVIDGAGTELVSLRAVAPEPVAPWSLAPIVRLPVGDCRIAQPPRAVATAEMKVKQFRGRHVQEERYTAILKAASDTPAELLTALAETAGEVEELGWESETVEQLIMHITIRWQRPDRDLAGDINGERSA